MGLQMQRYSRALLGVAIIGVGSSIATVAAQTAAPAPGQQVFAPRDEDPKEFPVGPGRDDTFYACTACHNFRLVAQQGLTREQWEESLTWMTTRHKMPDIKGKDREVILQYLSTTYGPKAPTGSPGWKNPFLK